MLRIFIAFRFKITKLLYVYSKSEFSLGLQENVFTKEKRNSAEIMKEIAIFSVVWSLPLTSHCLILYNPSILLACIFRTFASHHCSSDTDCYFFHTMSNQSSYHVSQISKVKIKQSSIVPAVMAMQPKLIRVLSRLHILYFDLKAYVLRIINWVSMVDSIDGWITSPYCGRCRWRKWWTLWRKKNVASDRCWNSTMSWIGIFGGKSDGNRDFSSSWLSCTPICLHADTMFGHERLATLGYEFSGQ